MSKSLLVALLLIAPAHAGSNAETPEVGSAEREAQVEERRDELAEARREGDQEDIDRKEGELAEALKDVGDARAE